MKRRDLDRADLAMKLADGRQERAERIERTGLLDVALDGRKAVHRRASAPSRMGRGKPYRAEE